MEDGYGKCYETGVSAMKKRKNKDAFFAICAVALLAAGVFGIAVFTSEGGFSSRAQEVAGQTDPYLWIGEEMSGENMQASADTPEDGLIGMPISEPTPEPAATTPPEESSQPEVTDVPDEPGPTPFVCPKPADLTWPGSALEDGKVVVVLDPGHGGNDCGTVAKGKKVYEKDITLSIVKKMKPLLEDQGITVLLTREEDVYVGLEDRADYCNDANADAFVSIHVNSYDKSTKVGGLECYYYGESGACKTLAEDVVRYLEDNTDIPLRGVRSNDYKVLTHTACTAILVETGYITSPTDLDNLTSDKFQDKLAQGLVDAILTSLGY